jgi:thymidylate synthase
MNALDYQYQSLLRKILSDGVEKKDRTGTGTISIFGQQIRHKMSHGFPLLTTKKMAIKTLMTELKWFLKGDTNIKYLVDNNCHIWDGDAYKRYINVYDIESREGGYGLEELHMLSDLTKEEFIKRIKTDDEFAKKWGGLGPIYGRMWRKFDEDSYGGIDQIQNLINELKTNPDSRRLMVTAWHPGYNQHSVLPPCHYGFQVYTRELSKGERMDYWFKNHKPNRDVCDSVDESSEEEQHKYFDDANVPKRAISLMWNQRSVDTFLGLPFNIASYAMLLCLIADEVNMIPEDLIGNLGDTHLYLNHTDQAKEQISREAFTTLPKLKLGNVDILNGEFDYEILDYQSHPTIKAPLSN